MGQQPDRRGGGDQNRRRHDHAERRALLILIRLARLLGGLLRHLQGLARRVAEPVEDAPGHPEHRRAGQDRSEHERRGEPGRPVGAAGAGDPALAQVGGERRQASQAEGGQREDHAGHPQPAPPAMQPGLVDRPQTVQHDPGAEEQGGRHHRVPGHENGRARQAGRAEQGDAHQEHPGVTDRGESEQPLDVPFLEAEQGADDGGEQAEGQERVSDRGPCSVFARSAPGRTSTSRPGRCRRARVPP